MKKKFVVILILLFLMILISGCINILPTLGDDSITPGKGRLKIYLIDAPGDYLEVNIAIARIEAHIAGDDEGAEGQWVVLRDWSDEIESGLIDVLPVFDLMILQDVSELLVDGSFDAGKYTQLRIFVTKVSVLLEEGIDGEPVEIPSVYQTGIKLIHPFEIVDSGETVLTIDFDAEKSIIKTGNGEYKLQPVIKF